MPNYKYYQESGGGGRVSTVDHIDEINIINELRIVIEDFATLLSHSKFGDGLYPKNGTSGGYLGKLNSGLDTNKPVSPAVGDMYLATDTIKIYRCFTIGSWTQVYPSVANRVEHFMDVHAADPVYCHAAEAGTGASKDVTVTVNPDVPRNASITTTNNSTPEGNVTVTGVLANGTSTTDIIAITPGGIAYGVKAFATISKYNIPAGVDAGDTVALGISDKIGLANIIDAVGDVYKKHVDGIDESDEISGNVNTTYGTLNCSVIVSNEDITIWYLGR